MSRHTYVTKGYSNYNDQEGGYAYGPEERVNWYVVETTKVERVRGPTTGYVKFGVAPMRHEGVKEFMPIPTTKNHHEGYGLNYGSSYENSSSAHYHEMENLMANFLEKIQIEASRPTNKFITTSSNTYQQTGPKWYQPTSLNSYRSTSPNNYRHTSSNNYRSTSPNRYQHTSPNRYRHTSPNRYRPTSPNRHHATSPNRYHTTSPNRYRATSPNRYHPTSPNRYHPTSPNMYHHTSPNRYRHTSPDRYRHTSSEKYNHVSLDKNRHISPDKYTHTSPNKYRHTSPTHNFSSKGQPIRAQRLSSPNKHWHSVPPPTNPNSFATPTHDIDEAISFLAQSVNNSKWSDPNKPGVDNLSLHGPSYEQERHTRHAFGGAKIRRLLVKKP